MATFEPFNRLKPCRHGLMLYNVHDVFIGRSLDQYGEWSEGEVLLFQQFLRPGMVVVEAGANIGSHTVFLANAVGPQGRVLAFEPQRVVFQTLCANVALNSITNVDGRCAAVGDAAGEIVVPRLDYSQMANFGALALEPVSAGAALGRLEAGPRTPDPSPARGEGGNELNVATGAGGHSPPYDTRGERVPVVTIDGFGLERCHLIKIDVEGMERSVLAGARETIGRCQPLLYVENERQDRAEELMRAIDELGYDMYWHCPPMFNPDNFARNPVNIFPNLISINMLCCPRSAKLQLNGFKRVEIPR